MTARNMLAALVASAESDFARRLGQPPRWVVAAPGRVNLIGEHTDYNEGFVLPMAIDRHVVIAADRKAAGPGSPAAVFSMAAQTWAEIAIDGTILPGAGGWASYVQGVVAGCLAAGLQPEPFEAVIHSDLALGGGLSSSAALEVATAVLAEAITGRRLDPWAKVLLCQKAEHDFAHVPCGIMDQCSSVMGCDGALLLLDCRTRTVQQTPLAAGDVAALIVNSNVKHALEDGGYASRRRQCEEAAQLLGVGALRDVTLERLESQRARLDDVHYRRARHVVTENERTLQAAAAVRAGDWQRLGQLMYASHQSLRDDFEVSCRELDVLVEAAQNLGPSGGVIGSRMTGGGFGGCTITMIHAAAEQEVSQRITGAYFEATGRQATAFVTRPVAGARILKGAG